MSLLRNITTGLRSLFRKEQVDRELDDELRAYQEMATEKKMKDGMSRQEALRAVRLERGSLEVSKEIVRSGGWESIVDTLWRDVRFGARTLRKSPGFTAVVVLTLALGIGANTTVFTVINTLLLNPLAIEKPSDVKAVYTNSNAGSLLLTSYPNLQDYREKNEAFRSLAGYTPPILLTMTKGAGSEHPF